MFFFFFFNDTATTEIYTLSLHDALPISRLGGERARHPPPLCHARHVARRSVAGSTRDAEHRHEPHRVALGVGGGDRKSTRLNSSHANISYAVFCLKKKKKSIYMYKLLTV